MATGLNIVFQTHWDREWYLSFEEYRHRLVYVAKRVVEAIENQEIEYFVFDGQVAAIEDLLDVCEEDLKVRLLALIKENRIIIGPWYVLADELLVTGESLVRNLEIGISQSNRYGRSQKVGYLPDTFGHISQMPQILNEFGIEDVILWRGISPKHSECIWKGADGTEAFTLYLSKGYYNPIIDQPGYKEKLCQYVIEVKQKASTSSYLLTNGGDHLMPSRVDLAARCKAFELEYQEPIHITNYEQYITDVKAELNKSELDIVSGELRDNDVDFQYMLPNVLSTRSYLKVENQILEDEILGYVEPLSVLASQYRHPYPTRYLEDSWKLILQNHPHDSICGCSIDEVHTEMMTRSLKVRQRLNVLQRGVFNEMGWMAYTDNDQSAHHKIFDGNQKFTLFNPHPTAFSGSVKITIFLLEGDTLNEGFCVVDDGNKIVPYTIISSYRGRMFESPMDAFPQFRHGFYYELHLQVENLPGISVSNYALQPGTKCEMLGCDTRVIENEKIAITLQQDGTLSVKNKEESQTYHGLNQYYTSLDCGDEYNYSKPQNDVITFATLVGVPKVTVSPLISIMSYELELASPTSLNKERTGGTLDGVVTKLEVCISLSVHSKRADIKVIIHNKAKDQRLRVRYPLGKQVDFTYSDSSFDLVKRKSNRIEAFSALPKREVPVVVDPSLSLVVAGDFAVYHRGLQEYQAVLENDQTSIDLTLIRSVGWLSRDDFASRGGGAGPQFETPQAQMVGSYEFEYAFELVEKKESMATYLAKAKEFRTPPKLYKGDTKTKAISLLSYDNKEVIMSSLRMHNGQVQMRVYNPGTELKSFKLNSIFFKTLSIITVDGRLISQCSLDKTMTIHPKKIMTLQLN